MSGQFRHRERYRDLKGPWFDWLFVSRDEVQEIVAGTGWAVRKFIEPEGDQYVGVIEKDLPERLVGADELAPLTGDSI